MRLKETWIVSVLVSGAAGWMALGCAGGLPGEGALMERSGAQVWQEHCVRCHNPRSPSAYSDDQWQVAVHHMRVRAGLTATEQAQVGAFLKASN